MKLTKELLEKYFNGACTEAEQLIVESALLENESTEFDAHFADIVKNTTSYNGISEIAKTEKKRLFKRVNRRSGIHSRSMLIKYAAAVTLLFTISLALFTSVKKQTPITLRADALPDWVELHNPLPGVVKTVKLTDGSIVHLNVNARICYDRSRFNKQYRNVELEGEAFFEIAHDTTRPFIVHTRNITTTVKGTKFNMEAYKNEKQVHITLAEGKVLVQQGYKNIMMNPDERVSVDERMNFELRKTNAADYKTWIETGDIMFNHVPLEIALNRISTLYNIELIHKTGITKNKYIQGRFRRQPVEQVLKKILFIHNLRYKKTGSGSIIITHK